MSGKYGCVLLAGGAGRRMGNRDKATLEYGNQTFADRICGEIEKLEMPCYVSSRDSAKAHREGWKLVTDAVCAADGGRVGPMGGIYSCLLQAKRDGLDGLFFVPCDAPLFRAEVVLKLRSVIGPETQIACWKSRNDRVETTFGWYSVQLIPVLEANLRRAHYKVLRLLDEVPSVVTQSGEYGLSNLVFTNINNMEEYRRLMGENISCCH